MSQIALGNWGEGTLNMILFNIIIPAILDVYNGPGTSPDSSSDRQSKEYYYHFTDHQYNICISQGYPEKQNQ